MINITLWDSNKNNNNIENLLIKSFNYDSVLDLQLLNNKTFVISLYIKNILVGSISLLSNNDLVDFLTKEKNMTSDELSEMYCIRSGSGAYLYNLAVNSDYRNKGIAKKLVEIALYVAKVNKFDYCYAHCENEISKNIFTNKEFLIENSFKNINFQTIYLVSKWI